jgi:hypothetical protein
MNCFLRSCFFLRNEAICSVFFSPKEKTLEYKSTLSIHWYLIWFSQVRELQVEAVYMCFYVHNQCFLFVKFRFMF